MIEDVQYVLGQVPIVVWAVFVTLLAIAVLYKLWPHIEFLLLRLWYDIPLVGKLARLAHDHQRDDGGRWYRSEIELCGQFHRFYPDQMTRDAYDRATSYLNKAQELGRRRFPWYGWAVVFILLVAEALSFGILLAGYIAQNATMRQQTWLGYLGAIVLAIVLLWLTHASGRQMHFNSLLRKARAWYATRPAAERSRDLRPMAGVSLTDNERDDNEPIYIQLASRLDDRSGGRFRPSYVLPAFTLMLVVAFGWLSFSIRSELFDRVQTSETLGGQAGSMPAAGGEDLEDIEALLGRQTRAAADRGRMEIRSAEANAAMAAFGALSVLFVAVQALGVWMGYGFGFSAKESEAAARIRGPFATADEFLNYHRSRRNSVARHAQIRLDRLQRKMHGLILTGDFDKDIETRTFRSYVAEEASAGQSPTSVVFMPTLEDEDSMRRRITEEVRQKLQAEHEAALRREIEASERERLQRGDA